MNPRTARFAVLLAAAFLLGGFVVPDQKEQAGPELFRDVLTLVSTRYIDTLEVSEVYERAAEGLVDGLGDPYAALYSPEELEEFTVAYEGHYAGVGMLIEAQPEGAVVRRVFPNTPAERIGAQAGDRVIAVNGESVQGWPLERISNALKGEPGTEVDVLFLRYGVPEPIDVSITRAVVRIPAVPYATTVHGDVGYVPLLQFNETAAEEVESAVRELLDGGARGLVLDLRGNGGGIVEQAVGIAGLFLPEGTDIARQWERSSEDRVYANPAEPLAPDVPLVVLVDGASASASEIVAGALQDHDRAVVLGTTSYGKGLVQTAYRVNGGYVLKMTTGKWFTPVGRSIHRERVLTNGRLVELTDSAHFAAGRDERPTYRSDAGRLVYGGGGITPDLVVDGDTLTTDEQTFVRAILPHSPQFSTAAFDYAAELKDQVDETFVVRAEWRDELYRRLVDEGVEIDPEVWEQGASYIDRVLMDRIGRLAFGDAYVKSRDAENDVQLMRAVDVIREGGNSQRGLFGYVESVKEEQG
ncbi:MAG: S41 family peptidase [Longimicrobiales bacterium]|nr:S41 family peptidase [Longimicrobiales bacterium]